MNSRKILKRIEPIPASSLAFGSFTGGWDLLASSIPSPLCFARVANTTDVSLGISFIKGTQVLNDVVPAGSTIELPFAQMSPTVEDDCLAEGRSVYVKDFADAASKGSVYFIGYTYYGD